MHLATALLFGAALWLLPLAAYAQTTRTEALEQERAERAKQLRPYEPKRLEKLILNAEEGKLRRLIAPHNGFFVEYGYTYKPTGSGIGFGGGFRHDLFERQARVVFEVGETFRHYRMARVDFSLPRLAGERLELGVEGIYRRHTQDDYYGPGPASSRDDRVSYLFKAGEFQGRAIVAVRPWLSVGTRIGRIAPDLGTGTDDRFPSIENRFDDGAAPGLSEQPPFLYGEAFTEIDYRDESGRARSGGHYLLTMRKYADRELDRYSFRSVDLLLQQFVPIFDKKRVFAFQLGLGSDRCRRRAARAVLHAADARRQPHAAQRRRLPVPGHARAVDERRVPVGSVRGAGHGALHRLGQGRLDRLRPRLFESRARLWHRLPVHRGPGGDFADRPGDRRARGVPDLLQVQQGVLDQ